MLIAEKVLLLLVISLTAELSSTQGIGMSGATSILSQLFVESVPLNTVKLPTR